MRFQTLTFVALGLAIALVCWPGATLSLSAASRTGAGPSRTWRTTLPLWQPCLAVSLVAGLVSGVIGAWGVLAAFGLLGLGIWHARSVDRPQMRVAAGGANVVPGFVPGVLLGALALAMALHAVPGFHNLLLFDAIRLSPDALPFTLYANADKGLVGLCLLLFASKPRADAWVGPRLWRDVAWHALIVSMVVMGLAWSMGVVDPLPKWPGDEVAWRFLMVNLLFTCVAEEAFFRGLIQGRLAAWLARRGAATWPAVVLTAMLFGLAHVGGGWGFAVLAGLAGLGYGLVCLRTGRVGAAIAVHFALNAVHFLFFTYPRLA